MIGKNYYLAILMTIALASCSTENRGKRAVAMNDDNVMVLDRSIVTDTVDIPLSELAEGYELIRFERGEQAMFQFWWASFSEHYVCIKQSQGPLKLFDTKGHYIHDVGAVGHGPGEYVGVYDVAIDEPKGRIFVAPFVGENILIYDLQGQYQESIPMRDRINKGRLHIETDGTLSLVHLCFSDFGDEAKQFTTACINAESKEAKVSYAHQAALTMKARNEQGQTVGFNNEIFAYSNTSTFAFQLTSSDTLYHFDPKAGQAKPYFTLKRKGESDQGFTLYNELPRHLLTSLDGKLILTEKKTGRSAYIRLRNDYLGGIEMYPTTQDGYIWKEWAPEELRDELKQAIDRGGLSAKDESRLRELANSLKDDDNDILLRARLKQ